MDKYVGIQEIHDYPYVKKEKKRDNIGNRRMT